MSNNVQNAQQFNRALQERIKQLREGVAAVAEAVTEETLNAIQADTPRDTGHLANSWQLESYPEDLHWLIFNPVPYAEEVEFGTSGGMVRRNTRRMTVAKRIATHKRLLLL